MKRKRNILFWLISILCIVAFSATKLTARQRLIDSLESKLNQHRKQFGNDTNTVNILYNLSITVAKRDPRESDLYGRQVIDISNKLNYERGNVLGLFHLGDMALIDKNLAKTKELYLKALSIAKSIKAKDLQIVSLCLLSDLDGTLGNISSAFELGHNAYKLSNELASNELVSKSCQTLMLVYSRLSQNIQAQLYGKKCIEFAIKTKNILYIFNAYSTYFCFSNDTINSNEFSIKALEITQYEGWKISEGVINLNLGWGEYDKKNITKALQFFKNSLAISEEVNNYKPQITYATCGIASCYVEMKVYDKAIYYAKRSMELCKFFKFPNLITQNSITLSKCYEKLNDYQNAFYYMDTNRMYNDTLFNTEILQKTTAIQVKAETDKKNTEIAIVEKEKDYQTFLRNTAIVGFILIFIIVVLLYHSYKLRKKSDESNHELILNVLPGSIAMRLKSGERVIADKFNSVSILFADIVNFTQLSQSISAVELVELLNEIFSTIDDLTIKYNLEKIKTIGDCYMVISGAPIPNKDHAIQMAFFALELQSVITQLTLGRAFPILFRIGIHSGEVVAGVIGKKKFAYDMWGDAVNTASRMESHGEPGRIHVSSDYAKELGLLNTKGLNEKNEIKIDIPNSKLLILSRGEMEIKGKGKMQTFFLEEVKS